MIQSCTIHGIDAVPVQVSATLTPGASSVTIHNLSPTSARESAIRVRAALATGGVAEPGQAVVTLECAVPIASGAGLDLPIALAILQAQGHAFPRLEGVLVVGELGLDGSVRAVRGLVSAQICALGLGLEAVLGPWQVEYPQENGVQALRVAELADLLGEQPLPKYHRVLSSPGLARLRGEVAALDEPDMCDLGMLSASTRHALEVAAAGCFNVLMIGPPSSFAAMVARRWPSILPPLDRQDREDVARIYSAVGLSWAGQRPFRAPHHSISAGALFGTRKPLRPGEATLAHGGVLFLDDLQDFSRATLEPLPRTLADQSASGMPARFLLVAHALPCPCGWHGVEGRTCICPEAVLARHRQRLAPLLPHFPVRVVLLSLKLSAASCLDGEDSASIRRRVVRVQEQRLVRGGTHLPSGVPVEHEVFALAETVADLWQRETVDDECFAAVLNMRETGGFDEFPEIDRHQSPGDRRA